LSRVAKRYSKAVFELAVEKTMIDEIESDFKMISEVIQMNSDITGLLENPLISESYKLKTNNKIFKGSISGVTLNLFRLMAEKKRLAILPEVVKEFQNKLLDYRDIITGELISAVELSETHVKQIYNRIEKATGKSVILEKQLDPDIIGGFIVKVGDVIFDNSIRFQLNKLRERLVAQ
jgi:F-type H+-transporting ATPase subunit delta